MSFDEQPDGDPHGECAAEIHRLESERNDYKARALSYEAANMEQGKLLNEVIAERDELRKNAERWNTYLKYYDTEEITKAEWKGAAAITEYIDAAIAKVKL